MPHSEEAVILVPINTAIRYNDGGVYLGRVPNKTCSECNMEFRLKKLETAQGVDAEWKVIFSCKETCNHLWLRKKMNLRNQERFDQNDISKSKDEKFLLLFNDGYVKNFLNQVIERVKSVSKLSNLEFQEKLKDKDFLFLVEFSIGKFCRSHFFE